MLGHKPKLFKVRTAICLEDLVPQDNFYRQVEAKVDLSFVRDLVKDCYSSSMGRPSIGPLVFIPRHATNPHLSNIGMVMVKAA